MVSSERKAEAKIQNSKFEFRLQQTKLPRFRQVKLTDHDIAGI
jgi:hypothetical protein